MTIPRKNLISMETTPFYHVVVRAMRRSWLFGEDPVTGTDYSHRKQWIVTRMHQLAAIFTIDICAYAVMSSHYNVVLQVDHKRVNASSWEKEALRKQAERHDKKWLRGIKVSSGIYQNRSGKSKAA